MQQPPDLKRYQAILKLHAVMTACGITPPRQSDVSTHQPTEPFETDFAGVRLVIEPGVFEPGPMSASVVDVLVRGCIGVDAPVVADVGTGSGAIAIAFAHRRPDAQVFALDFSTEAVRCAANNALRCETRNVVVLQGSLLEPLVDPAIKLNAIVATLPFVPHAVAGVKELMRPDRWRGPRTAVVGTDADGLGLLRELVRQAEALLEPDGFMVLEMEEWQTEVFAHEYGSNYRVEVPPTRHFVTLWRPGAELRPVL